MNKIIKNISIIALVLAAALAGGQLQAASLLLDPLGGAISGQPGQTVGWGFTLTNDDAANYLVVSSTDFQPGTALGMYTDFAGPQLLEVAPLSSVTEIFDSSSLTGIGSFAISPIAHLGDLVSGRILLTYDLFSQSTLDPNFDPSSMVSSGNIVDANASVSAVPEPGAFCLLGSGLVGLICIRRKKS
jgi:hypothetical protein